MRLLGRRCPRRRGAFAYDPETGNAVRLEPDQARASHRDYSRAAEGWVCGTADAVAIGEDRGLVADWKSGAYAVPPPELKG